MKNKKLVIGNVVLFYIVGFLSMILVDQGNRMDLSDSKSNLFTAILRLFKIDLVNITMRTWLMLIATLGLAFVIFLILYLFKDKVLKNHKSICCNPV